MLMIPGSLIFVALMLSVSITASDPDVGDATVTVRDGSVHLAVCDLLRASCGA